MAQRFSGIFSLVVAAFLATSLLVAPMPSFGKNNNEKPKKALKQPKIIPGSEETPGQRSARLSRECKGGVNAGACTGYTR